MKIDRHNYEEFFILYMDGELAADERKAVEAFVALHPDLKEELELLQQFKLQPDPAILFTGKEELLKIHGETPVTTGNFEEWFTQYTDDELTPDQKKMVEDFIISHPETAKDLLVFQRTKLQPETIVFAGKSSLYRTEKDRRVVPLRWWKIAVAAALVIGLGLATYSILDKKAGKVVNEMAGTTPSVEQNNPALIRHESPAPSSSLLASENPSGLSKEQRNIDHEKVETDPVITHVASKNTLTESPDRKSETIVEPKQDNPILAVNPTNNLPKPESNPNFTRIVPLQNESIALNNEPKVKVADPLTNQEVTTNTPHPSGYITAANSNKNEVLEQPDGKKNKLRGFFRKITRTFDKRTNADNANENNDLLVAGLSIKLR